LLDRAHFSLDSFPAPRLQLTLAALLRHGLLLYASSTIDFFDIVLKIAMAGLKPTETVLEIGSFSSSVAGSRPVPLLTPKGTGAIMLGSYFLRPAAMRCMLKKS
jgi:hypothetical protein